MVERRSVPIASRSSQVEPHECAALLVKFVLDSAVAVVARLAQTGCSFGVGTRCRRFLRRQDVGVCTRYERGDPAWPTTVPPPQFSRPAPTLDRRRIGEPEVAHGADDHTSRSVVVLDSLVVPVAVSIPASDVAVSTLTLGSKYVAAYTSAALLANSRIQERTFVVSSIPREDRPQVETHIRRPHVV